MTQKTDRQRLQEEIANTAFYYGRQLNPAVVTMMTKDLEGYPPESAIAAYESYRKNPKNRVFPLPAQIIEILDSGGGKESINEMVVRLIAAVKRYDYTWPMQLSARGYNTGSFEGDFKANLGHAAWNAVQMHGGWDKFCDSYWNCASNETAFKAQLRDLLEGIVEKRLAGNITSLPEQKPPVQIERGPNEQQIALLRMVAEEKGITDVVLEIDRMVAIIKNKKMEQ